MHHIFNCRSIMKQCTRWTFFAALDMEVEAVFGQVVCSDRGGHEGGNGTG